eukprot:Gb_25419 [translate_table: standard]
MKQHKSLLYFPLRILYPPNLYLLLRAGWHFSHAHLNDGGI